MRSGGVGSGAHRDRAVVASAAAAAPLQSHGHWVCRPMGPTGIAPERCRAPLCAPRTVRCARAAPDRRRHRSPCTSSPTSRWASRGPGGFAGTQQRCRSSGMGVCVAGGLPGFSLGRSRCGLPPGDATCKRPPLHAPADAPSPLRRSTRTRTRSSCRPRPSRSVRRAAGLRMRPSAVGAGLGNARTSVTACRAVLRAGGRRWRRRRGRPHGAQAHSVEGAARRTRGPHAWPRLRVVHTTLAQRSPLPSSQIP